MNSSINKRILLTTVFLLYFCLVLPVSVTKESWMIYLVSEPVRLWTTVIALGMVWGIGLFCYHRLILHPSPPEQQKE